MRLLSESRLSAEKAAIWKRSAILDLEDFSVGEIGLVFSTADAMREILSRKIKRVPTLRGKTIATLFYEPSTRTRASFELAAKILGADVLSLSPSTSSIAKGESLIDTMRTLSAMGIDALVLRHPSSGAPLLAQKYLNASLINAGDGTHAHPTQALLDLYTIKEAKGDINKLKVVIVGDILHSRVARSNIWGLTLMGAKITLCGPPPLLPLTFISAYPWISIEYELEGALRGADVVMALRLQKERHSRQYISLEEYIRRYQINRERLSLASPDAVLLHPGPVNVGVELSEDVITNPRSLISQQVKNGLSVRMALLYLICQI